MADRFGAFPSVSGGLDYQFPNGRWMISTLYGYHFGNKVKEDVLDPIRNERGIVMGSDGLPADLFLRQRAYSGQITINYLYDFLSESDSDLSLVVGVGMGYIQHWIRLQDERNTATQLNGAYEAGYDRKTAGFTTNQFVGIQYLQGNKRINFYAGFDLVQGFTSSIRPWNYDTRERPADNRIDLLHGFRLGWILPFYLKENAEIIYY